MTLPMKIRSIKQPNWTDELHWSAYPGGSRFLADVDHDWRVSCDPDGSNAVVWHKGYPFDRKHFVDLAGALGEIDYRIDA